MKIETFEKLKCLENRYGESIFGKIVQCLIALAFYKEITMDCITINLVEGIDIIVDCENLKYVVEVKTTTTDKISLNGKDFEGLQKYKSNGYLPLFYLLKIDMFSDGLLIRQDRLQRKTSWRINELYTDDELKELCARINQSFESLVEEHYSGIYSDGLKYLSSVLKEKKIKYSGKI